MLCRTIEIREGFEYTALARKTADLAIELGDLIRGRGYKDVEVQEFVRYLDEVLFEDRALGRWSKYVGALYETLQLPALDTHQHYEKYYREQIKFLKEFFFDPLRNVGSRGTENATKLRDTLIKMSRLAMSMSSSRHECF